MQQLDFFFTLDRIGRDTLKTNFLNVTANMPLPLSVTSPWICGGAIRNLIEGKENTTDYDIFFKDEATMLDFTDRIAEDRISETDTNITFHKKVNGNLVKIQAIKLYYPTIQDTLDSFDFTITQFGFDGQYLYCGDYSLFDLARKRLALHKLTFGVSTVRRLIKYTKQGFTACPGVLADILHRTVENPSVIREETVSLD